MKKNFASSVVTLLLVHIFLCATAEASYLWHENKYATIVSSLGQRVEESCKDVPYVCDGYHTGYVNFKMNGQTPSEYLRYAGFQLNNHAIPVFERYQAFFRNIRVAPLHFKIRKIQ